MERVWSLLQALSIFLGGSFHFDFLFIIFPEAHRRYSAHVTLLPAARAAILSARRRHRGQGDFPLQARKCTFALCLRSRRPSGETLRDPTGALLEQQSARIGAGGARASNEEQVTAPASPGVFGKTPPGLGPGPAC